jgi:hypothetical protein
MPIVIEGLFHELLDKYDPSFRDAAADMLHLDVSQLEHFAEEFERSLEGIYGKTTDPDEPHYGLVGNEVILWWVENLSPVVVKLRADWLEAYPDDDTFGEQVEKLTLDNLRFRAESDQKDAKLRKARKTIAYLNELVERLKEEVRLEKETVSLLRDARYCRNCDSPLY